MIPFLPVEAAAQPAPANVLARLEDADAPPAETAFAAVFASESRVAEGSVPLPDANLPLTQDGAEPLIREAASAPAKGDPLQRALMVSQDQLRNEGAFPGKLPESPQAAHGMLVPHPVVAQGGSQVSAILDYGISLPKLSTDTTVAPASAREGDGIIRTNADLPDRLQANGAQRHVKTWDAPDPRPAAEAQKPPAIRAGDASRTPGTDPQRMVPDQRFPLAAAPQVQAAATPSDPLARPHRQGPAALWERSGTEDRMARSQAGPAPDLGGSATRHIDTLGQFGERAEGATKAFDPAVGLGGAVSERVSSQPAVTASHASLPTAPETARHAASQMAVAIAQKAGQPTDIALQPEELGRVRMSLSVIENSVTLTVFADRPETADLLRRHIDLLAQEFRTLGYADISFSFGGERGGGKEAGFAGPAEDMVAEPREASEEAVTAPAPAGGGLDLRI